jgi:predicted transcriptional regulator of viral defense system
MPKQSRISLAKTEIGSYFSRATKTVFSTSALDSILQMNRKNWQLPKSMQFSNFVSSLCKHTKLKPVQLQSTEYNRSVTRFAWGEPSPLELAQSISLRGYISHGSAAAIHGLTTYSSDAIYLNIEQSPKPKNSSSLTQKSINLAFSRKQRQSNLIYRYSDISVIMLAGKNTEQLGVEEKPGPKSEILRVTNLERTLIDIVVRPNYAGGPEMVLEAYRAAKEKMSVDTLLNTLERLDYVYPYHQAIGYLMERADYPTNSCNKLRGLGLNHDFYLAHKIEEKEYCKQWRLYYPKNTTFQ